VAHTEERRNAYSTLEEQAEEENQLKDPGVGEK
jgi:hypothetical protein